MLTLPISPRCTLICVVALNSLFIVAGIIKIGIGIHRNMAGWKPEYRRFEPQTDAEKSIISGSLDILIGACGVAGALLKIRKLLIANAALLTCSVLGNLIMIIIYGAVCAQRINSVTEVTKQLITRQYGNLTDTESRETTQLIDDIQIKDTCCGWSRNDNDNLFLQSPWFRKNVPERKLPDSCCISTGDECIRAPDIADARKQGFVKEQDCLAIIVTGIKTFTWISIAQQLILMLLQIPLLVFAVFMLLGGEVAQPE